MNMIAHRSVGVIVRPAGGQALSCSAGAVPPSPLQLLHDELLAFGHGQGDASPRSVREALAAAQRSAPKELVVQLAWQAWRASGAPDLLVLGCGHRISALRLTSDGGHECEECVKRAASEVWTCG